MVPPWVFAFIVLVFVAGIGTLIIYPSEEFTVMSNRDYIPPPLAQVLQTPVDNTKYLMNPYGLFKRKKPGMITEPFEESQTSPLSDLVKKINLNTNPNFGLTPGSESLNEPLVQEVDVTAIRDKPVLTASLSSEKGTGAEEIRANEPKVASVREHLRVENSEEFANPHAVDYRMQ